MKALLLLVHCSAVLAACPSGTTPAPSGACVAPAPSSLVISSPQSWNPGAYVFDALTISSTITISGTVNISARSLILGPSGSIVGDGGGFGPSAGPCWDAPASGSLYLGTGALHGGCPAPSGTLTTLADCPGPLYSMTGNALAPVLPGSGGKAGTFSSNCPPGGSGGAALLLTADTLQLMGLISMNGQVGSGGNNPYCDEAGGGGAGGSILVRAGVLLQSSGTLRANGGDGGPNRRGAAYNSAPPGGGGRIAIHCTSAANDFLPAALPWPIRLSATGGTWSGGFSTLVPVGSMGGAGTLYADCGLTHAALLLAGDPAVFRSPMAYSTLLLAGGGAVALSSVTFASSGSLLVAVPPGAPPASLCIDTLVNATTSLGQGVITRANVSLQVGGCTCLPGTFSTTGGALPCYSVCPSGFSCTGNLATPCPAGTASPAGSAACTPCTAGAYSAARSSACTPCPAGSFGASPGLTSPACSGNCSAAPPGYGCPAGSTASAPVQCTAGYYCPGGDPPPALPCAPGSYSTTPGSTACALCPVGSFCAGGGAGSVPCYPATACTLAGLAVQPVCYWNVSTLAGSGAIGSANGMGTSASFNRPHGLALSNGYIFVGDSHNYCLRFIASDGTVDTATGICGGADAYVDGTLTAARFGYVDGLSALRTGEIMVADNSHAVRLVNISGKSVSTVNVGQSIQPIGVYFSNATLLVAACQVSNTIVVANPALATSFTIGAGAGYRDGAFSVAMFNTPSNVLVHNNAIYVTDTANNRIRLADLTSKVVSTLVGGGIFVSPCGIGLFNSDTIMVADVTSVSFVRIATGEVTRIAGRSSTGYLDGFSSLAAFNTLAAIIATTSGTLVVSDSSNYRIRTLSCVPCPPGVDCSSGAPAGACAAGTFCPPASTAPLPCPAGSFCLPGASIPTPCPAGTYSAAVGGTAFALCITCPAGFYCPTSTIPAGFSGTSYVTGATAPIPCTAAPGYGCVAGSTTPSGVLCPTGYVCYGGGGAGTGSGVGGGGGGSSGSGSGGSGGPPMPCVVPSLCSTPGLAYVPPFTVSTKPFSLTSGAGITGPLASAIVGLGGDGSGAGSSGGSLLSPEDVAYDATGSLAFVSTGSATDSYHFVLRIALSGPLAGTVSLLAGSGPAGVADAANGPMATFNIPGGLAPHTNGTLYLLDLGGHKLRAIAPSGAVTTVAGSGVAGFANGAGTAALFSAPTALALDAAGASLYLADTGNNRIRRVVLTAGGAAVVSTVAGTGVSGGLDGASASATFSAPWGLALENATGALLVADAAKIRRLSPNGTLVATLAGNGSTGLLDGLGTATATFASPRRLSFTPAGLLLVADAGSGTGGAIRAVSMALGGVSSLGLGALTGPHSVAAPPTGGELLLVADTAAHVLRALVWSLSSPTPMPSVSSSVTPTGSGSDTGTQTSTLSPGASPSISPSATATPTGTPTATLSTGASPSTSPLPPSSFGADAPPTPSCSPAGSSTAGSSALLPVAISMSLLAALFCCLTLLLWRRRRASAPKTLSSAPQGKVLHVFQQQQRREHMLASLPTVTTNPLASLSSAGAPSAPPPPAAAVWARHEDETGDVWFTSCSGETVWELPPGAVVQS